MEISRQSILWKSLLTRIPLMLHIWVSESGQHWFKWWLVAYSAPSYYLNQCWVMSIAPVETNFSEILIKIQNFSLTKMHIVCETAAILSRGRWVNIDCLAVFITHTLSFRTQRLIAKMWLQHLLVLVLVSRGETQPFAYRLKEGDDGKFHWQTNIIYVEKTLPWMGRYTTRAFI